MLCYLLAKSLISKPLMKLTPPVSRLRNVMLLLGSSRFSMIERFSTNASFCLQTAGMPKMF